MADALWPSEDAGDNEQPDNEQPDNEQSDNEQSDNEQSDNERAIGSGPLGTMEQVTAALNARILRRFSEPLNPQRRDRGDRGERGDTDEVETLSPSDAHLLSRFLAQPPAGFAVEGTSPLPGVEMLPTIPTRAAPPTTPLRRRFAGTRTAILSAPPLVAAPAVTPPAPLDVARLILRSFHVILRDEWLPSHVLARLDITDRRLWLAPALAPMTHCGSPGSPGMSTAQLAQCIEARPFTRYLLAALWAVTHAEMPSDAPPARTLTAMFAPASGLTRHAWQRWHGAWYTRVWRMTNRLVAPHVTLDRLTASYLNLDGSYGVPRLGAERRRAVLENALRVLPHLRSQCRTAEEMARASWQHYTSWLARVAAAPQSVILDRLDGDTCAIRTPDDLCAWTDDLLAGGPELGHWRAQMARGCGLWSETTRRGGYITAAQRGALWIAEPG